MLNQFHVDFFVITILRIFSKMKSFAKWNLICAWETCGCYFSFTILRRWNLEYHVQQEELLSSEKKEVHIHIIYVMLNKNTLLLFLCIRHLLLLWNRLIAVCWRRCYFCRRFITNAEQFDFSWGRVIGTEQICYKCWAIYFSWGSVIVTEQICYKCWASSSSSERDLLLLLEELLWEYRSVTNAEQVVPYEKEICYFCGRVIVTEQICYTMLNKLFLMRKTICYFCGRVIVT